MTLSSNEARLWSEEPKHVAIKIRKPKFIVVFDGNYKQFVYTVTH
jgi:hypothetical protein